ncbi:hypothetical protein [Sporosarcina ureae]|uniref:hypothetical protein n=1 Tax=Sporosarcina ureae TaxID=1571 RepID=UPI000A17FAAD|nr:hypothetical protein [Sporosarcina ureae]ARK20371.1 hypothetical protein SporoP32a_01700 [Sporosarcina ureae]
MKKSLMMLIGIIMILAACSEENVSKDKEDLKKVNTIDSIYKNGDISISIAVSQKRVDQGETPIVSIKMKVRHRWITQGQERAWNTSKMAIGLQRM